MAIRVLPPNVSSLIAAGEVIDRPASVIRELLENALDAGASSIEVEISGRHFNRIVVSDNGIGMAPGDLELACHRHATSKLPNNDITAISTLGFRGEALPSIAAVARLRVVSRPLDQDVAFQVVAQAGKRSKVHPCAGGFGTRVEVEQLFDNLPARQAFQKSFATEMAAIQTVFDKIALCWPSTKFVLRSQSRTVTYPVSDGPEQRIKFVRGEPLASNAVALSHRDDGISVTGLVSLPTVLDEAKKGFLDIVVNGRVVSDRTLSAVVQSVYKGLTGTTHRPFGTILLQVDPSLVNMNVHPTKSEVRFRDSGKISEAVRLAVLTGLQSMGLRSRAVFTDLARNLSAVDQSGDDIRRRPLGKFLTQANNSWLIAETMDGIVLIDQHAAHERVILERLKRAMAGFPEEIVRLGEPHAVTVSHMQAAAVDDLRSALQESGFDVSVSGSSVRLHGFPSVLSDCKPDDLVDLIVEHSEYGTASGVLGDALWERLATSACKAAIKAGHRLSPERADALLREIEATPNASFCNHGRPTVRYLSNSEIGGLFER
jgi:DNA mismatch repair protein MutL